MEMKETAAVYLKSLSCSSPRETEANHEHIS
jgi:hypothetical protein